MNFMISSFDPLQQLFNRHRNVNQIRQPRASANGAGIHFDELSVLKVASHGIAALGALRFSQIVLGYENALFVFPIDCHRNSSFTLSIPGRKSKFDKPSG
jgi:hypothetical protein